MMLHVKTTILPRKMWAVPISLCSLLLVMFPLFTQMKDLPIYISNHYLQNKMDVALPTTETNTTTSTTTEINQTPNQTMTETTTIAPDDSLINSIAEETVSPRSSLKENETRTNTTATTSDSFIHSAAVEAVPPVGSMSSQNNEGNHVPPTSFPVPTDENTAIAMILIGSKSYLPERCIRSLRTTGNFSGYILLLTDQAEEKIDTLKSWDNKTILVELTKDDIDMNKKIKNQTTSAHDGIDYHPRMMYKRFKTLLLNYVDQYVQLNDIQYVLYLDIDNVAANSLSILFKDYHRKIGQDYENFVMKQDHNNTENFSFFSMWKDPGQGHKFWQGGQIMLHRQFSQGCAHAWRHQMDNAHGQQQDQPLLMNVYNNFSHYQCTVFELPSEARHFQLATDRVLKTREKDKLPTLIHITTMRTKRIDINVQREFLLDVLQLNATGSLVPVGKNSKITWAIVASPSTTKGQVFLKKN